jgi:drug/metabolite transporter (DMT)-like permease
MEDAPVPEPAREPRFAPNVEGALWILASGLTFTLMTSLIKFLGDDYPAALQTFYRQTASFLVLLPIIVQRRSAAFATNRPWLLIFRASAGTLGMILMFYAFQHMPLADANALSFTRALWVVPLAFFILREKVGPVRLAATLVGFGGVLIMMRPGASGHFELGAPALAVLGASFLFSLTVTGMKVMSRDHSPTVLLVWSATLGLVFALPPALFVWRWPSLPDLGLLALMGVVGTLTQACYIRGMSVGDAAAMAPIDYSRLVFAAIVGFAFFHETPTVWTITGAGVVVASTLIITLREQQLARRARASA